LAVENLLDTNSLGFWMSAPASSGIAVLGDYWRHAGVDLHWPSLDGDVYPPRLLLEGLFGSQRWMAGLLGKSGGLARTEVQVAVPENSRKGWRPRQVVTA
jgi:hypothetical protein